MPHYTQKGSRHHSTTEKEVYERNICHSITTRETSATLQTEGKPAPQHNCKGIQHYSATTKEVVETVLGDHCHSMHHTHTVTHMQRGFGTDCPGTPYHVLEQSPRYMLHLHLGKPSMFAGNTFWLGVDF